MKHPAFVLKWLWLVPLAAVLVGSAAIAGEPVATDWPQWLGPNRDGISAETGWRTDWAANPPKVLWKAGVGQGYSAVSVAGGLLYTMGFADGKDTVFCLDAETGAEKWKHSYPSGNPDEYLGPRMQPTVCGDLVYTLGRQGDLFCFERTTGKIRWQANLPSGLGSKPPRWGFACSPLVLGDNLIIDAGPMIALSKNDGKLAWKSGSDIPGYSSPVAFKLGGATLIAGFNDYGPHVVDAEGGKPVGRYRWETEYGVNSASPVIDGNLMFISSGYGRGAALFEVSQAGLKVVWENKNMRNHTNGCVLWKGCLYGFDGQVDAGGLACIDFKTGAPRWSQKNIKMGGLMIADGKLIIMSSKGDLIIAGAAPDGYKELARATEVLTGDSKRWTMPVLSGGRIYCRNHGGQLVSLDVRGK